MTRNLFFGCTFQVFMLVSIISHGIIPLFLLIGLYNKVYVAFSARSRRLASMTSRQRRYYVTWYKLSRSILYWLLYRPTLHFSVFIQVTVQCSWTDKHWNSVESAYVIPKKLFITGDCLQALKIGLHRSANIFDPHACEGSSLLEKFYRILQRSQCGYQLHNGYCSLHRMSLLQSHCEHVRGKNDIF